MHSFTISYFIGKIWGLMVTDNRSLTSHLNNWSNTVFGSPKWSNVILMDLETTSLPSLKTIVYHEWRHQHHFPGGPQGGGEKKRGDQQNSMTKGTLNWPTGYWPNPNSCWMHAPCIASWAKTKCTTQHMKRCGQRRLKWRRINHQCHQLSKSFQSNYVTGQMGAS